MTDIRLVVYGIAGLFSLFAAQTTGLSFISLLNTLFLICGIMCIWKFIDLLKSSNVSSSKNTGVVLSPPAPVKVSAHITELEEKSVQDISKHRKGLTIPHIPAQTISIPQLEVVDIEEEVVRWVLLIDKKLFIKVFCF